MTRNKLNKLKRELLQLRRAPQRAAAIERFAKRLGRKKVNRGKEPVWESTQFTGLFPLAIPHHGGKDLAPGTKSNILDLLEGDITAWEYKLEKEEEWNGGHGGEDNDFGE